jgi:hypothetical protein
MSQGSVVSLFREFAGPPAGSLGHMVGFYRRPKSTEVLVSFACGRTARVPFASLMAVQPS